MVRRTGKKKKRPDRFTGFKFNNIEKKNKNFTYQNLAKSNCYNSDFSASKFDYVSFRGAHFKSCNFFDCSFVGAEFVGSNLKGSRFVNASFEDVVFESVKLIETDFKGASFKNVVFMFTDITGAKNLNVDDPNIRVMNTMPDFEISDELKSCFEEVMQNPFVKKSRVLDTREGNINYLSLMLLLEKFDEQTLIKGLRKIEEHTDREFHSLSYIIKLIHKLSDEKELD